MIAQLEIHAASIEGITFLKRGYCNTPFKIANITEDKKDPTLRLMLMSSSPGILNADEYKIKIELDQNASLQLHTQSLSAIVYHEGTGNATYRLRMASGSACCFIPHPVVPHRQSSFTTRNTFYLSENCNLIFGEVLTCGRKLNGEVFSFSKYHSITQILINDKLVIKENLLMQPDLVNVNSIGQLQGYTHQASLVYLDENAGIKTLIPRLYELVSSQEGISIGISAAPVNGLMVRMLGQKAEQLFDCLKLIAETLLQSKNIKPISYAI